MASDAMIAQDGSVSIQDGGVWTSNGPIYGSVVNLVFLLKRATVNEEAPTVDMRAWGDANQILRPLYGKATVTMDIMIQDVGELDIPIGNFIAAEVFSGGSAATQAYEGILTKKSEQYELDQVSMQTIELQGRRTA